MKSISSVISLAVLLSPKVHAAQKRIQGPKTTVELPLQQENTENGRPERMSLEYWTTLLEPKRCVRDPFECDLNEYIQLLEGDLTLKNVATEGWKEGAHVEMRLAFNQFTVSDVNTYDVYKFYYSWKNEESLEIKQGWKCEDGYSKPLDDAKVPTIDVHEGSVDKKNKVGVDSFTLDKA